MLRGLLVCALMAVMVSARSGTLAPTAELESFLESGVHTTRWQAPCHTAAAS